MANSRVASRYAKSVLDLAVEQNQLEAVKEDMEYLRQLTKQSTDFLNLLRSPVVNADLKKKAVEAVAGGKISALTTAFLNLMITKAREAILPEVITSFIKQYKDLKGIHIVKLTTAVPVTESLKTQIIEQVKATSEIRNIELEEVVDPNIIGGFVLQAGDKLVDASIAYDLKNIARQFESNDYIYKVR